MQYLCFMNEREGKKRIAVIFEGNINNRLGVFFAVLNRVRHLRQVARYDIDVHMLQVYDGCIMRKMRGSHAIAERPETIDVEGERFVMHWYKRSWTDAICRRLLGRRPRQMMSWINRLADDLSDYDLISAHDRMGGLVAQAANQRHGITHCITWHGASIYTDPPRDTMIKALTCELLKGADMNFFVSKGLKEKASLLTDGFKWEVLLNGASADFKRFDDEERNQLREEFGAKDKKVVAFVGRFSPVKNVTMLPEIYSEIARKYAGDVTFWTIGAGVQHEEVRQQMAAAGVNCRMWGAQPLEMMPRLMNCIDVLVLPSSLEGLPLVTLEALQCGANVVASDVVGTAEGIGKDNAISLDEHFVEHLTDRAVLMLEGKVEQALPPEVSWTVTAEKENKIYEQFLNL